MQFTSFITNNVFTGQTLLFIILIALLVVLLVLVVRTGNTLRRMSYPVYDYAMHKAETEAEQVLEGARVQAREIITQAEKEALQFLDSSRKESEKQAAFYGEELKALTGKNKERLTQLQTLVDKAFQELEAVVRQETESMRGSIKEEVAQALSGLKANKEQLQVDLAEQIKDHLDRELSSVQKAVDAYRESQLKLIDVRIIKLIEHTAAIALQKELTVNEHAESVYRALEEARKEGALS
jgi:vacuolar-type H+-ATPase subunit H